MYSLAAKSETFEAEFESRRDLRFKEITEILHSKSGPQRTAVHTRCPSRSLGSLWALKLALGFRVSISFLFGQEPLVAMKTI